MSKRQFSKQSRPPHKRSDHLRVGQLARSLRREWRGEDNTVTSSSTTREHVDRALALDLPADVEPESLAARAMMSFLEVRATMTSQRAWELGSPSITEVTSRIVFEHFVPDQAAASAEEIIDVSRGIGMAKVALKRTEG